MYHAYAMTELDIKNKELSTELLIFKEREWEDFVRPNYHNATCEAMREHSFARHKMGITINTFDVFEMKKNTLNMRSKHVPQVWYFVIADCE